MAHFEKFCSINSCNFSLIVQLFRLHQNKLKSMDKSSNEKDLWYYVQLQEILTNYIFLFEIMRSYHLKLLVIKTQTMFACNIVYLFHSYQFIVSYISIRQF